MKKFTKIVCLALVCVFALCALTACAPNSDPDKALASLKENEYTAMKDTIVVPAALALAGVKGIDVVISGSKVVETDDGTKGEHVTVVYFLTADAANSAWETVQKYAEDEKEEDASDWKVQKFGKMIFFGTSAGIRAAM